MRATPQMGLLGARVVGRWTRRLTAVAVLAPLGVSLASPETPTAGSGALTGAARSTASSVSTDMLPIALKQAGVPTGYERSSRFRASPDLGVPAEAVRAYRFAESVMQRAKPSCGIDWSLLAAIGDAESDHGRYGGAVVRPDGTSAPAVLGPRLDGSAGFASVPDTDDGQLDGDRLWDRAVGPMQFIPSTWALVGSDADGDGDRDPHDIDDAALAAAVYLCAGGADLRTTEGQRSAVYRYNHSTSYVDLVLELAAAYADGVLPTDLPAPERTGTPVGLPTLTQPVARPAHPARPPVDTQGSPSAGAGTSADGGTGAGDRARAATGAQRGSVGGANGIDVRTRSGGSDTRSESGDSNTRDRRGDSDTSGRQPSRDSSTDSSTDGASRDRDSGGADDGTNDGTSGDADGGGDGDGGTTLSGVLERPDESTWTVDGEVAGFGDEEDLAAEALADFDGVDGVESNLGELETLVGQHVTVVLDPETGLVDTLNEKRYR